MEVWRTEPDLELNRDPFPLRDVSELMSHDRWRPSSGAMDLARPPRGRVRVNERLNGGRVMGGNASRNSVPA